MTKQEFIKELNEELASLSTEERKKCLAYYEEAIDDLIDDGWSEAEACSKQGSIKDIAEEITNERMEAQNKKRKRPTWFYAIVVCCILTFVSVIIMMLMPDKGTLTYMNTEGNTASFVAAKVKEPIVLYIVASVLNVLLIIYGAKKQIKKVLLSGVCLMLCIVIGYIPSHMNPSKQEEITEVSDEDYYRNTTASIVYAIFDDDFSNIAPIATEDMQSVLADETMKAAKAQIATDWGTFVSMGSIYIEYVNENGREYAVASVVTSGEHVNVSFTVVYDELRQVAGLYMK
ncbi:MAG: DUF1700 domain-containing protein [Lachnospiraceae bacterium]|nr:DUF1700 domain-containing protein [Lachnospiraceae bacterium]